jgi:hypothetical protein
MDTVLVFLLYSRCGFAQGVCQNKNSAANFAEGGVQKKNSEATTKTVMQKHQTRKPKTVKKQ